MTSYKSITLNLDKDMISQIETLMDSKFKTEKGVVIFEVHFGNKQDFYRRLLREGFNVVNLAYEERLKIEREKYGDKSSSSSENKKKS